MIKHPMARILSRAILVSSAFCYLATIAPAPTVSVESNYTNEHKKVHITSLIAGATLLHLTPDIAKGAEIETKEKKDDDEEKVKETYDFKKIGYLTTEVNVRKEPNTDSEIYKVYPYNKKIKYSNYNDKWIVIKYKKNKIAYLYKEYVSSQKQKKKKEEKKSDIQNTYTGTKLTRSKGINNGPSGKETYYNLSMNGVVRLMQSKGYNYSYWIRSDGVKMYGDYIMLAANTNVRPKGTILQTSLGLGMVCDHCVRAESVTGLIDIAVTW